MGRGLDNHIHLIDVQLALCAAEDPRLLFVHLHDHHLRLFRQAEKVAAVDAEIKVAVLVHGRDGNDQCIRVPVFRDVANDFRIAHGNVIGRALIHGAAHIAGAVPALPQKGAAHGHEARGIHEDAVSYGHMIQLMGPLRQGRIEFHGEIRPEADFDLVAVFNQGRRFFCRF